MKVCPTVPLIEQLEDRLLPAPQFDLADGTTLVVLSPAAVLVLPPLQVRQNVMPPARPAAPLRPPAFPPFAAAPPRPRPRPQFVHDYLDLYLPAETDCPALKDCPVPKAKRKRWIGWAVLRSDRREARDEFISRCSSEKVARLASALVNSVVPTAGPAGQPPPPCWAEWWSTSSQLEPEAYTESPMQQTGTLRSCYYTDEGGTMWVQQYLQNPDTGEVYFQGDPEQVQDGWCLTFGPVCIECETTAAQGYEQGGRPEATPKRQPQPMSARPRPPQPPHPRPRPGQPPEKPK